MLIKAIHQKPLLNAYKSKKNRDFALFLNYVRQFKIPVKYEKTSPVDSDAGNSFVPRF